MELYRPKLLRYLISIIKNKPSKSSQSIQKDLEKARNAWFSIMAPYKNSFGRIQLPHLAPMLTQKQIKNCILLSNREEILKKMIRGGIAAEVGVQTGEFSQAILNICSPSKLHLIDIDLSSFSIEKKFENEINSGIVQIHEEDSSSSLRKFPDRYFDFIFIDGDHTYSGVKDDIEAGKSKLKDDGFLIFNDYTYWSPVECIQYGVIQAINELCIEEEWEMIYFALGYYMYCDVALRRQFPTFRKA